MKIAIIGAGIAGIIAAHELGKQHDVLLLEKKRLSWGHTNTILIPS